MTSSPDNPAHPDPTSVRENGTVSGWEAWSASDLERVRARDLQALGRFFDVAFPRVYGLVLRLLGNVTEAEDATQEVFVKVHQAIERLDPQRSPGPWLTTIAYNVCRDRWRSAGTRLSRSSVSVDDKPEVAAQLTQTGRSPEEELVAAERERLVQQAIDRLPPPQREVVVLHDYEGLTHEEVATVLSASPVAIRKRHSRALATLAALLKDELG